MRKDRLGNFIFDERTTTIQDLIDLCQQEFPGVAHEDIVFPDPNGFYSGPLEYFDMIIGKRPELDFDKFLARDGDCYGILLTQPLTLAAVKWETKKVPGCDFSKSRIMWHKGRFSLIVNVSESEVKKEIAA